jgi:hypothetical protein
MLIVTMHMYIIYRRVGWFGNYLGRKDLHGYDYSISNYILRFLTSHISSIFRYNNIWLVTTRLTVMTLFLYFEDGRLTPIACHQALAKLH